MEPLIIELIKQAPSLAALIWMVATFLKHISLKDSKIENLLDQNNKLLGRVCEVLDKHEDLLEEVVCKDEKRN